MISEEFESAEWQIGGKIEVRIGVDVGGTKIEIIALDDNGATLLRRRGQTPVGDYAGTVRTIVELVQSAQSQIGTSASVGVATPGALSPQSGLLRNSNSVVLNGKPLDRDISSALGQSVRLENDANCLAISEAADGAGAGCRVVFGAILGTGVGGGIVVDGKILAGLNRIGGEWGHDPLPWATDSERPGYRCYCGKYGCIETFLSGAGLTREYFSRSQKELPAEQIAASGLAADPHAVEALATCQNRLARSLAAVVNVLDPDVIVLGGGMSNIGMLYDELAELIAEHAFSDGIRTRVVRAAHGDFKRRQRSRLAVADQDLDAPDAHEEIVRLEERAEELAAKIQKCRKFILAGRIALVVGVVALFAMLVGVIRSDLGLMAGSVASLLGGFVVWGSNSSTAKEAAKDIATVEAKRAALIEWINPRVVS